MQPRKLKVFIARFPYGGNGGSSTERPEIGDWLVETVPKIKADPRCEDGVGRQCYSDTPIPMTRNRAMREARKAGCDVLLMVDSDQVPDVELGRDPDAKPFWDTAFDFLYEHYDRGPCVIAAPYCGPPPSHLFGGTSNVYVFRYATDQNDPDERRWSLRQFLREEAAERAGVEQVAALPTGLCMVDLRICNELDPPWFNYEWEDKFHSQKASTEDVFFTRNCAMIGVPQYVTWDCWAGHAKEAIVGKPRFLTPENISDDLAKALKRRRSNERIEEIGAGKSTAEILAQLGLEPRDMETVSRDSVHGHRIDEPFATCVLKLADEMATAADHVELDSAMPLDIGKRIAETFDALHVELRPKFDDDDTTKFGSATPDCDVEALQRIVSELADANYKRPLAIVEVGSWFGASARAMADALGPQGGTIHCVDTFAGSDHDSTRIMADTIGGPDGVYDAFLRCNRKYLASNTIIPYRLDSQQAAQRQRGHLFDLVYIDAGHEEHELRADIEAWLPLVQSGGVLAGHDYGSTMFPAVARVVDELRGKYDVQVRGAVWSFTAPHPEDSNGRQAEEEKVAV